MNLSGKTTGQSVTNGLHHLVSSHFTTCKEYLAWRTWRETHLGSIVRGVNSWSRATAVQPTGCSSITVLDQTSERTWAALLKFLFPKSLSMILQLTSRWFSKLSWGNSIPAMSCNKGAIFLSTWSKADKPAALTPWIKISR